MGGRRKSICNASYQLTQQSISIRLALLLFTSMLITAGNIRRTVPVVKNINIAVCRVKILKAGIGITTATKKAHAILDDVNAILAPVFFRISPVKCSYKNKNELMKMNN